ncbi:HNH endonuclease signature motif containing protein [Castellaniella denitrificans]|uniref:HNH endonuclease signature motif containing protein n=1 Tax=Castellaniella denitrificans TaxID=56119 RepID=UPI00360AB0A9
MSDIAERLMRGVEAIPFSGCWIWTGALTRDGYGRIFVNGKARRAHRVAFEVFKGIPANDVCHTCDTPSCINPAHLFDGTHSDNMRDREGKGRANKATGERNRHHRFSFQEITEMRAMRQSGVPLAEIATKFSINGTGYVSLVVNNKIRKTA